MRWTLPFVVIALCSSFSLADESPREFVRRFYSAYKTWPIRGVPLPEQERLISPFCGTAIIRVFRKVNQQRSDWERKFPHDSANPMKPPWCIEGDVFCDVWEGVTYFSVGRAARVRGRVTVEAHLELVEQGKTYPWTDRVILDRAGDSWVIADIEYARGGSLVDSIQHELDDIAKYLVKKP